MSNSDSPATPKLRVVSYKPRRLFDKDPPMLERGDADYGLQLAQKMHRYQPKPKPKPKSKIGQFFEPLVFSSSDEDEPEPEPELNGSYRPKRPIFGQTSNNNNPAATKRQRGNETNAKAKAVDNFRPRQQTKPMGVSNGFLTEAILKYLDQATKREPDRHVVIVEEFLSRPQFCDLLGGELAAVIDSSDNGSYPVMVKQIYQTRKGQPKTVEEIAKERAPTFYLEPHDDGEWGVKKGTKVWFEAQNIMASYKFERMVVICYAPYGQDVFPVDVTFDKEAYCAEFENVRAYLMA